MTPSEQAKQSHAEELKLHFSRQWGRVRRELAMAAYDLEEMKLEREIKRYANQQLTKGKNECPSSVSKRTS